MIKSWNKATKRNFSVISLTKTFRKYTHILISIQQMCTGWRPHKYILHQNIKCWCLPSKEENQGVLLKVFLCVNIYIFICVYECFYLCSTFCWCVNVLFIMPVYFVFCSSLSLNSQNIYIQLNSWMFVNLEYKAQAKTSRVLVEQFGREISLELFWPKFFFNYLTDENLPYLKK